MLLLRQFFTLVLYTVLTVNAVIMTLRYLFGLGNIFGTMYELIENVSIAGIL